MSCLSQTPPLGGLSPPQGVFQGHAAHLAEWSAKLRPKGSWGTCIPQCVTTFFYTAFTAHSDAGADAVGSRLQRFVSLLLIHYAGSRLQLLLQLIEKAPVCSLRDQLLRAALDHAHLVQAESVEAESILGIRVAPTVVGKLLE